MIRAYKQFWLNYTNFSGRSSRSDYWWVMLCQFVLIMPLSAIFMANVIEAIYMVEQYNYNTASVLPEDVVLQLMFTPVNLIIFLFLVVYGVATLIPTYAITSRRLRDAGFHWALVFLNFIPYIGPLILLVLCVMPSQALPQEQTTSVN